MTVEAAYRIGKKSKDRARPIKVKFRSLNDKNEVMALRKKLKGTTIYVNNDMTKLEKENSELLHKHFKDAKEKGRKAYYRKGLLWVEGKAFSVRNGKVVEVRDA